MLIQKSDSNTISDFFLPKPQYIQTPVQTSNYFIIKLQYNDQRKLNCNCINIVKVYNEVPESNIESKNNDIEFLNNSRINTTHVSYQWYQSKEVIKGFKFLR